ncbi:MAG: hypothetical protein P8012_16990 [Desulfobacterales bacterium]
MLIESYLEKFIEDQHKAIRFYIIFAASFFIAGILIIFIFLVFLSNSVDEPIKTIIGVGGGFISSVSAFPLKEVINRKERMSLFLSIKTMNIEADEIEKNKIEELVWKTIEKIAVG